MQEDIVVENGPARVPEKLAAVEAMRGLASVSVLLAHLIIAFWPSLYGGSGPWSPLSILKVAYDGQLAVCLFFVLSGFVLSLSFFKSRSLDALSSAASRRYLRLMLPAACSILAAYLLLKLGWMYNVQASNYMEQHGNGGWWIGLFYSTISADFGGMLRECVWDTWRTNSLYNQNLWTMQVELAGSVFVYSTLALFGGLRNRSLIYLVFAGIFLCGNNHYLFDFLLGVWLCDLYVARAEHRSWSLPLPFGLLIIALGVLVASMKPGGARTFYPMLTESVASLLILAGTVFCPGVKRFLERPLFSFLGQISFGLYLVHLIVICSLTSYLYLVLRQALGLGHNGAALLASAACIASSVALAWGTYLFVDQTAIRLGKWLYGVFFQPVPQFEWETEEKAEESRGGAALPVLNPTA